MFFGVFFSSIILRLIHNSEQLCITLLTYLKGFRNMVTHYPSTAISCTEVAPYTAQVSQVVAGDSRYEFSDSTMDVLKNVHISAQLMDNFLQLARNNTEKDLETCGVIGASLREETFYATTLIIPKQESTSTSSSCQAINEADIFNIQNDHSLLPVGWIHTHPSQSCFMSSIDLHTHYSYQVMVPEAIAIVVAPTDKTRPQGCMRSEDLNLTPDLECKRNYGIFRLTDPSGLNVVKECDEKGFHLHRNSNDGRPLYEQCSHVYINPNLRFEIFDLR